MKVRPIAILLAAMLAAANVPRRRSRHADEFVQEGRHQCLPRHVPVPGRSGQRRQGRFPALSPGAADDARLDGRAGSRGKEALGAGRSVDHANTAPDGKYKEPALRGIALVYDVDEDGTTEVVAEFWADGKPMLYVLDGATGKIEHARPSPLDLDVRGGDRSRCHPVGQIARLDGKGKPPAIVLKYEASGNVPGHAVALDAKLNTLWHVKADRNAMGHIPTVGDVDGDGREEIIVGRMLISAIGQVVWQRDAKSHADCTAIFDWSATEKAILISICGTGPAFCVSAGGKTLWEKTTEEVSHGQGIWAGNFLDEEPGAEVIILRSGHVGDFLTVRGRDGSPAGRVQTPPRIRRLSGFPVRRELAESEGPVALGADRPLPGGRQGPGRGGTRPARGHGSRGSSLGHDEIGRRRAGIRRGSLRRRARRVGPVPAVQRRGDPHFHPAGLRRRREALRPPAERVQRTQLFLSRGRVATRRFTSTCHSAPVAATGCGPRSGRRP